jgi:DNA-binding XRE family transcriptional regulator
MLDLKRHDEFDPESLLGDSPEVRAEFRAAKAEQAGGTLLIRMRQAAGLTTKDVAGKIGVAVEELDFVERGQTAGGPTLALVIKVAQACGTRLSVLYPDSKEPLEVTDAM